MDSPSQCATVKFATSYLSTKSYAQVWNSLNLKNHEDTPISDSVILGQITTKVFGEHNKVKSSVE